MAEEYENIVGTFEEFASLGRNGASNDHASFNPTTGTDDEGEEAQDGGADGAQDGGADGAQDGGAGDGQDGGADGGHQSPTAQIDLSAFGDFKSQDDLVAEFASRGTRIADYEQKIKDLEQELGKSVNPFRDKNIALANALHEQFGDEALAVASRMARFKYDPENPIETLVQAKLIEDPAYIAHEQEYRDKLESEFGSAEGLELLDLRSKAKEAASRVEKMLPEVKWIDPKAVLEQKNKVREAALASRSDMIGKLSAFEFDGVKIPVGNASELADLAINKLVESGKIDTGSVDEAVATMLFVAKVQALESGELAKKWSETKRAEIEAEYLKSRRNPSVDKGGTPDGSSGSSGGDLSEIRRALGLK